MKLLFWLRNDQKLAHGLFYFQVFATYYGLVHVNISSSILLCILVKLSGWGSLAVAVGVSDMWQVTFDMWHVTPDIWQLTPNMWHLLLFLSFSLFFLLKLICIGATIRKRYENQCLLYVVFSPNPPLGRFGLVVAMSISLSVPFHVIYF